MAPPTPPTHLFRTIRTLQTSQDGEAATYLCLPRALRTTKDLTSHNTRTHPSQLSATHNLSRALKKSPFALIQVHSEATTPDINFDHAAQLMIVKMHNSPSILRHEETLLQHLHAFPQERALSNTEAGSMAGGDTQTFLGSWVTKSQHTGDAASSWLCTRPQFGRSLREFGWYSRTFPLEGRVRPVDSFFVWHIFLSLLEGLSHVHTRNLTVNDVSLENVVLNPFPAHGKNWFRDWPDVVLVSFERATKIGDGVVEGSAGETEGERQVVVGEIRAFMELVCHVIGTYSDVGCLREAGVDVSTAPLMVFLNELMGLLGSEEDVSMAVVREKWEATAKAEREKGPHKFPRELLWAGKSELVDAAGLGRARAIVLNQFGGKMEDFRAYARARRERWPVAYKKDAKIKGREEVVRGLLILKFVKKHGYLLTDKQERMQYLKKRRGWDGMYDAWMPVDGNIDKGDVMEID